MTNNPDIASPARTQAILNRYHLSAKKSLGQNFLTDLNVLNNIVKAANLSDADNVIEIGPGIGGLTEYLARSAKNVLAFEIDQNLLPVLDDTLSPYNNVKIINDDILQANLPKIIKDDFNDEHPIKVVANLPYYITTPIILDLLKGNAEFDNITVMMQKEVAQRLVANPGSRDYGSLSVIIQYMNDVKIAFEVPRKSFIPAPNVDSAIVTLSQKESIENEVFDVKAFSSFVRGCFAHRRKTFWNNMQGLFGKEPATKERVQAVLDNLNIKPSIRPEKISVNQYVKMANAFHSKNMI
ncbi:16S rRNA (adenine(1518)-N(6)/adenine(1519)-N(6))-dimethyltransferase RsmA [Apilactobacillus timberlakei]|uniref:Ribosomal RNA small subunit methyltransferase A n=1 Tax=Apilactobacillus timberlakei TaxID=2008380 RepID=A0ABY2YRH7_9LACO|nr:16S rRNA (adenine(1518)-N(6)/adenine(1519)-N(6))-dimethyltransferase RsmA [Apilactobacillus timberlakei]TPR12171.1 16S rRNA (adenine(1518)-N(6)/adenine(1519)-N(6))-dimethyltransferase RsmA [Apilactobacillus timberlakei]TPR12452.1 16S rRNA (adenine(1518)-N(6)/adenine(1519)-N(6))-dimethyltransferase RsmA [Apilactobacillus timberlakei]TPR13571.1 16S rRNA (adenine(1518)-N(6)/adenine(1519)-N(6))-dimethyltransferase RsmA [Apilactobacillus timberlakei]